MSDSPLPLPNDPAARTSTGELLDATKLTPTSTETSTNEPVVAPAPTEPPKPDAPVIPDTYTFKTPDGTELKSPVVESFAPVFKELGLTQAQADKLVAAYAKHSSTEADLTVKAIEQMGQQWEAQTKADPEMGPKLDQIKSEIGRALEQTLTTTEREAFQKSMNITMAGNNPDFVRAFWKMSQKIGPGAHVTGSGPSTAGQNPRGAPAARPSFGAALYPNLARDS